ncbi:hypothetical protein GRJ2_001892100 [Grus japonensis]|uniref:Uncharacterized protein n=1 Tax=Grus japonensis TaxID=30415 RepID=A0ABC9X990_GRUJA
MVGLDDFKGLFQPKQLYDSKILYQESELRREEKRREEKRREEKRSEEKRREEKRREEKRREEKRIFQLEGTYNYH